MGVSEVCAFCMETFYTLRKFIRHVNKNCEIREKLRNETCLSEKQHRTIRRTEELRKASNVQLYEQLKTKGTAANESSVVADARRYSNGMMKDGNKGATPESLASTSRKSGEGDRSSSELGSWFLHLLASGVQTQTKTDNPADESTMQAEGQRPLQKRRRTDTNVVQSNGQRHIEDECAEVQLPSRKENDNQDDPMQLGTIIG